MDELTRIIAGEEITLKEGQRYIATRPFAERGRTEYPVTIQVLTRGINWMSAPAVKVIEGLGYDKANEFLLEFNTSGSTSLDGRVW